MIDIENQVITAVTNTLGETKVYSDLSQVPSAFPCVYVVEADNYTYQRSLDSKLGENHANVMYEVHFYTNDNVGKKMKCKALFATVDDVMQRLGFVRLSRTNITQNNATVYRIVGRYSAVVSKNEIIYGR